MKDDRREAARIDACTAFLNSHNYRTTSYEIAAKDGFDTGYRAGYDAAANPWVSIQTDGLPKESCPTYLTTKSGAVEEIHFWNDADGRRYFREDGVAWMLKIRPAPYTPEGGQR